jgi:hypothetical protein
VGCFRGLGGESDRRARTVQYVQRADSFQVAPDAPLRRERAKPRVRNHTGRCPTRRRPRSSVRCRAGAPIAAATSAATPAGRTPDPPRATKGAPEEPRATKGAPEEPRATKGAPEEPRATKGAPEEPEATARSLLAGPSGERPAPSGCGSRSSRRAPPRRRGAGDRFRPPAPSSSRPSCRPRPSWPRSACRSARARFGARSGACPGPSSPPTVAPDRPPRGPPDRPPPILIYLRAVQPSGRPSAGGRRGNHLRSCTAGANRPRSGGRSAQKARARQLTP